MPTRLIDLLFSTLIGGNKARRMDPNQEQDILDVFEECSVSLEIFPINPHAQRNTMIYVRLKRYESSKIFFVFVTFSPWNDKIEIEVEMRELQV